MTIRIDLSSTELNPDALLEFIRAHATHRPSENILFKVSPATFALHRKGWSPNYVRASPRETAEMNAFLGVSWTEDDYGLDDGVVCNNCGRVLTFYDVVKSGLKRHGDQHMRATLAGGDHHLQVAKHEQTLEFECTSCGGLNFLRAPTHYSSGNYTYV